MKLPEITADTNHLTFQRLEFMIGLSGYESVQVVRQSHHQQLTTALGLPVVVHVGHVSSHLSTDCSSNRNLVCMTVQC